MAPPNPYLLAADNSPSLLPLLRSNPALASQQDAHGYSLVHAAASYNHLDLLRALVRELRVPVDLRDEDAETALFVVETVSAARVLVEELGLDPALRSADGLTALEKIDEEGDFPEVAQYLKSWEAGRATRDQGPGAAGAADQAAAAGGVAPGTENGVDGHETSTPPMELPPVPEGLSVTVGTMAQPEDVTEDADTDFRARIEALAAREDFHTEQGQAELRQLVQDAVMGHGLSEERNVRSRQD